MTTETNRQGSTENVVPDLKTQWLQALRSGNYEQTLAYLRFRNGYCCLGVLCHVVDPTKWQTSEHISRVYSWEDHTKYLPDEIAQKFPAKAKILDEAMKMNDDGCTFADIANYLEANL